MSAQRTWPALLLGLATISFAAVTAELLGDEAARQALPHWIGTRSVAWKAQRTFTLPPSVQRGMLRFAADFCSATVRINDRPVLSVEPFCQTVDCDVTAALRQGPNRIVVNASCTERHVLQGVALSLVFETGSDDVQVSSVVSAGDWEWTSRDKDRPDFLQADFDRGPVRPELWGVGRRDASVSPLENYEQWRQATADGKGSTQKFYTPPGFEVSLLRTAAPDEGSWIALTFDAQGRALVSREDKGFLRFTLADDHKAVTRVESIASELREVRGLLFDRGRFFADANSSKGLYSFRLGEDGRVIDQKLLREFPGETGHGRNDLAVHTHRAHTSLLAIFGDSVARPEVTPNETFADVTSPLRTSRRNLAQGENPLKEGWVARTDLKGEKWQLFCCGLRNPYGIAANSGGDFFTYDADNEFDMGTPWYRPTRILLLYGGADFGYSITKDNRRPHFVDNPANAQPLITVGRGSPTAVMFGTDLKFPQPYRNVLYVLDWTYGRVLAVHLAQRGAGYRAALETFLQGRPLNVTDVAAGPDGAMYLITGGRKTQSSLYRVAFKGIAPAEPPPSYHERLIADNSQSPKLLRLFGNPSDVAPKTLFKVTQSDIYGSDPILRNAARVNMERLPLEMWLGQALESDALENWISVVRGGDQASQVALLRKILARSTGDEKPPLSERFVLSYLIDQLHSAVPQALTENRVRIVERLVGYWPDPTRDGLEVSPYGTNHDLRRRLIYLLAKLDGPQAVDLAAKHLLTSAVQEDRLAALSALATMKTGWTPETRRLYFTALRDGRRFVGGQGMPGFLDQIKTDAVATLSDAEKADVADLLTPPKDDDEPLPPQRPLVRKWTLDELTKLVAASDSADAALRGDPAKGAVLFREALCSRCHRAGAVGPAVGPDLSFVAARFSRRDILHSVLHPSAAVAEQYRNSEVTTDDGRTLTGRVVSEGDYRSEKLLINTDPLRPSRVMEVDKKQIAEHRLLGTSPMPEGLLDGFTAAEIRDLLAFLEAGTAR